MAGDWIPIRNAIATDPAVISITASVEAMVDEDHTVGKLCRLWAWANEHLATSNANVTPEALQTRAQVCARGVTASWIDTFLCAPGFADAMIEAGWLSVEDGSISFPDFDLYNSQSAKQRLLTARRVKRHRAMGTAENVKRKCNARGVTKALPEKRREEESIKNESTHSLPGPDPKPKSCRPNPAALEAIYQSYPRHEAKKAALKAIENALLEIAKRPDVSDPAAWLLERVAAYAEARKGQDTKYTPHPASWFNAGRYDDDQEQWKPKEPTNGPKHDDITTNAKYEKWLRPAFDDPGAGPAADGVA
jgi:hypothetical protein